MARPRLGQRAVELLAPLPGFAKLQRASGDLIPLRSTQAFGILAAQLLGHQSGTALPGKAVSDDPASCRREDGGGLGRAAPEAGGCFWSGQGGKPLPRAKKPLQQRRAWNLLDRYVGQGPVQHRGIQGGRSRMLNPPAAWRSQRNHGKPADAFRGSRLPQRRGLQWQGQRIRASLAGLIETAAMAMAQAPASGSWGLELWRHNHCASETSTRSGSGQGKPDRGRPKRSSWAAALGPWAALTGLRRRFGLAVCGSSGSGCSRALITGLLLKLDAAARLPLLALRMAPLCPHQSSLSRRSQPSSGNDRGFAAVEQGAASFHKARWKLRQPARAFSQACAPGWDEAKAGRGHGLPWWLILQTFALEANPAVAATPAVSPVRPEGRPSHGSSCSPSPAPQRASWSTTGSGFGLLQPWWMRSPSSCAAPPPTRA